MAAAVSMSRGAPITPFGAIAAVARRAAAHTEEIQWPSPRWAHDPVAFADDVLDTTLWTKQVELVESIRDHRNTSCRSGHKCGKTTALAVVALWFYASFDEARVLMTAVKAAQVDEALWREVKRLHRRAKKRGYDLGGVLGEKANYGLRADDGRQIWGMTARDGEGLAGISGPNILVLADEASGIPDRFFEVLGSSLAGSGGTVRKCYISNPTRTTGEFYRSHTTNAALFNCIHISSEDTPNARGEKLIPGLAGEEWIEEKRIEYGVDSHAYRVRVCGDFVHDKDGKVISRDIIALAQAAWEDAPDTGVLQIGVDPAGDGVLGDETTIAVRRGGKIITVLPFRGITEDDAVTHIAATVVNYRKPREPAPRVCLDAEGGIGTRVAAKLRVYLEKHEGAFEVVPVRSGQKLWGSPEFDKVRDGLWGQAAKWLHAGGALPDDAKLADELNAPSFTLDTDQRYRATEKKQLRKDLGRSPDRADAVCLAIWGFERDGEHEDEDLPVARTRESSTEAPELDEPVVHGLDPYAALGAWGGR